MYVEEWKGVYVCGKGEEVKEVKGIRVGCGINEDIEECKENKIK